MIQIVRISDGEKHNMLSLGRYPGYVLRMRMPKMTISNKGSDAVSISLRVLLLNPKLSFAILDKSPKASVLP